MGKSRAGLSEDPTFASGYEAIFGEKKNSPLDSTIGNRTTVSGSEIANWFRTEDPSWLDRNAVEEIKAKIELNNRSIWNQPIQVAEINGKVYVFDGHHRLTAVVELGYAGPIPIAVIRPPDDWLIGEQFGPFDIHEGG